jgi:hypothetical protein
VEAHGKTRERSRATWNKRSIIPALHGRRYAHFR